MDGNELAAQFIGDTRWNGLPDAVQHKVKMCLVDIIAAIAGGVSTPISDIAAGYAPVAWPGGPPQKSPTKHARGANPPRKISKENHFPLNIASDRSCILP